MDDTIDPAVGFVITVKPGDRVTEGEPVASVFARDQAGIELGLTALAESIVLGEQGSAEPLISHRITARGIEAL